MSDQNLGSTPSFFPSALRHGLIMGGVAIILSLIGSITGLSFQMFFSLVFSVLIFVVYALAGFRGASAYREELGGHISFGSAFITSLVACAIAVTLASAFSVVYMNFIDPSIMLEATDSAREMMEKMGADEDVIDEAMRQAEERMSNPIAVFFQSFVVGIVISLFASLIIGAVVKREEYA